MVAPLYVPTGAPIQGSKGQSKTIRDEFTAIETAMDLLNAIPLFCFAIDANTAGSFWIPTPGWAGDIQRLYAVNYVANTVAAEVYTVEIGGSLVTLVGAWQHGATDAAGTQVTETASAANSFTAGQPIEIISSGAGGSVMPVMFAALIKRTS